MAIEVRELLEKKQNEAFSDFVVVDCLKKKKNTFVKVNAWNSYKHAANMYI